MPEQRRSLLRQAATAFGGNTGGYVFSILTGIVVARALGPEGKGIAAYAALVMAVFTNFAGGIYTAVMRLCSEGTSQRVAYGAALRLTGATMLPISAIVMAVAILVPRHAELAYTAFAIPFSVYVQVATAILLLNDDVRSAVVAGLIPTVGAGICTIPALLLFHGGLPAVLAIWAGMFALTAGYALVRVNSYLPALSLATTGATVRRLAGFGARSGSLQMAGFLNLRIDVFMVGALLDARALGIYTLAVATGELLWQLSRPIAMSAQGRVAAAERPAAAALTCTVSRHILALELLGGAALFVLAPTAVHFVYGAPYTESGEIVRWLLPGMIMYAGQSMLGYFVVVKDGRPTAALAIQCASIVACAAICAAAIPRIGLFGAALATSMTYGATVVVLGTMFARSAGVVPAAFLLLQRSDLSRARRLVEPG